MGTWFRHVDRRDPFLWESPAQPAGRWHGAGEGPAQYLASTPDGAWAEFLRHEEIVELRDLAGIERALWAIEVDAALERPPVPELPAETLVGGLATYEACQAEARRLRAGGADALRAPSAALLSGAAGGQVVRDDVIRAAEARDGEVLCLFGSRAGLRGFLCVEDGRPPARVLPLVRSLADTVAP
jgi:RES domain